MLGFCTGVYPTVAIEFQLQLRPTLIAIEFQLQLVAEPRLIAIEFQLQWTANFVPEFGDPRKIVQSQLRLRLNSHGQSRRQADDVRDLYGGGRAIAIEFQWQLRNRN